MRGYRVLAGRVAATWATVLASLVLGSVTFGGYARADAVPPEQQVVAVTITAGAVTISPATVRPGQVTFRVTNRASVPYDVDIDGPGPDGEIEHLPAGATRSLTMTLRAGSYDIEGDPENGGNGERHATLTVRG
ncbi:MAG TPA: hypothetical protein VF212_07210 [Longimicrobiales bacterium]